MEHAVQHREKRLRNRERRECRRLKRLESSMPEDVQVTRVLARPALSRLEPCHQCPPCRHACDMPCVRASSELQPPGVRRALHTRTHAHTHTHAHTQHALERTRRSSLTKAIAIVQFLRDVLFCRAFPVADRRPPPALRRRRHKLHGLWSHCPSPEVAGGAASGKFGGAKFAFASPIASTRPFESFADRRAFANARERP